MSFNYPTEELKKVLEVRLLVFMHGVFICGIKWIGGVKVANQKILDQKALVVDEIVNKTKESATTVFFNCTELSVADLTELRRKLKENDCELKVYKNTLAKRAMDKLNYDMHDELNGPKAVAFGSDTIMPIKLVNDFAKDHPTLELRIGIVDGVVTDDAELKKLASIPSRDTMLTMFAAGLIEHVKNVAICLDLHAKNLED